ncbi:MAG TPA: ATP synthase subunit I [Candidatus Xenobia bacterium]
MTVLVSILGGLGTGLAYGWFVRRMLQGLLTRNPASRKSAYISGAAVRQGVLVAVVGLAIRRLGADPLSMIVGLALGWTISRWLFRPRASVG